MWTLESFYYVIQHQIVFKLLECHPGVVAEVESNELHLLALL